VKCHRTFGVHPPHHTNRLFYDTDFVPEKADVKKDVHQAMVFLKETGVSLTESSQPKGVKRKMADLKLRSGV